MSGKFTVRIDLKDEEDGGDVSVFANDGHLAIQTEDGQEHTILDDRTVLGSMASQDADSVAITGGSITGITPLAVSDGGTGASTAAAALANIGAVPTSRTVNGKPLSANISLGPSDVGALPSTTTYGASLEADGEDISLIDQNGNTLATVQTQDITGKLDKQAVYSSLGVTSTFFHEEDGGGYQLADSNDNSLSFIGGNADTDSPIKIETYAKTVADNIGTRIIQTLEKVYYTAGKSSATYVNGDEVAVKADIPTALSQLTNDGNFVTDASYIHTDNNYTTAEKDKLSGLDDNHFKGSYPSLTALETAHPTANDGDYAYVGVQGTPATMYIWDVTDSEWVQGGSPAGETPASVKEKYESNLDTNAYTDDEKAIVGSVGDVADLATTNKDTLVEAVNEVVGTFSDYVPTSRTVNGKPLSSNITLTNSDIGSEPAITAGTAAQFWQGNKSWQNFGNSVRTTLLTGLSTATKTSITATDTTIVALGKLQAQVTASLPNPMTSLGDIIVGGQSGAPTRLPIGDDNTFLKAELTPSGDPQLGYSSATNTSSKISRGAAYGNGYYVFCGEDCIGCGTDLGVGLTTSQFPGFSFTSVQFLNNNFLVTCSDGTVFYATNPSNPSNWSQTSSGLSNLVDAVFFKNYYVVAGSSGIAYSSNLSTWTTQSTGISSLTGIACSTTDIGVVNGSSFSHCSTVNGSWVTVSSIGSPVKGLAYGNGYWCAGCTPSSASTGVTYSSNMATWSGNINLGVGTTYSINFANGNFLLSASSWKTFYTSDPSGSWTSAAHPMYYPYGVAYGNGYYLFFGNASSGTASNAFYDTTIPSSSSGATRIQGFILTNNINAICYGNSRYYYVGDGVHGYFSPGTSVSFNNTSNSYVLRGVCMGLPSGTIDTIVACGDGGKIVQSTSSSFSTLSEISSGTTNDLVSMAKMGNTFVAVGKGGTIVSSQNISSGFSPVTSGTTNDLNRVRVVNGMFVAVGNRCVLFSTDGVVWSSMDNIYGNPNITDVVYHDTSQKYIFTSYDETSGQVFITDDIAHYYVSIPLTVSNTPLLTIFVVNGWPIVAGAGGYAAISKTQGNDFTVLPAGVTKDINDMLWTDTFIGAIACSDAVVGLNKFSGGASNVLTYKPVPLASTSSPGIVQPDNATLSVDTNGTLSAFPPPIPIATTTTLGGIKPDGTSITVNTSTGVASAVGGGGGGSDSWVPSSQYIDITYGVTGDTYVAPADGWIYVECTTFNTNASIIGNVIISEGTTLGVYMAGATTYSTGRGLYLLFPVGSGYFFRMFNSNLNIDIFRFVYAKGALVGV